MLQLVPAVLLFLQASTSTDVIDRISRLAASEPVEFGIDTRLKLAEALAPKYPEKAKRQLHDATASLTGVPGTPARNMWRVQIVQALAPLDFDEAEPAYQVHRTGSPTRLSRRCVRQAVCAPRQSRSR